MGTRRSWTLDAVCAVRRNPQFWGSTTSARLLILCIVREYRLFLCDDDDAYRLLLREVLSADGFEIAGEASDGEACIRAIEETDADVVLLDLNMPGKNGFEALPELRRRRPDISVIVLSTAQDQASASAVRRLGAAAFLTKPMHIFDLPGLLREALGANEISGDRAGQAIHERAS